MCRATTSMASCLKLLAAAGTGDAGRSLDVSQQQRLEAAAPAACSPHDTLQAACRPSAASPASLHPHENWCTSCIQVSSSRGLVLAPFISSSCNIIIYYKDKAVRQCALFRQVPIVCSPAHSASGLAAG